MSVLDDEREALSSAEISEESYEQLRQASRWMQFVGWFFVMLVSMAIVGSIVYFMYVLSVHRRYGMSVAPTVPFTFVIQMLLLVPLLYFQKIVLRKARLLGEFVREPSPEKLENAMLSQQLYWMLAGVFLLVAMLLGGLLFVFLNFGF